MAVTGTLLGWKKHSNGVLLAETQSGTTSDLSKWLPLDTLQQLAIGYAHMHIDKNLSTDLDRIDVRNEKGIVKFVCLQNHRK